MSEIDRLSNSGLYPALPIADRRREQEDEPGRQPPERRAKPQPEPPQPAKSIIDEYA
jgi:hypothetical protein